MKWEPIETLPEKTTALLYCDWASDLEEQYGIDRFRWRQTSNWDVVSESAGASGARRQIRQETIARDREWNRFWGATHWMPLPDPPESP